MMRRLSLALSLALSPVFVAPALAEMPEGISHFTLPNGLETVVIEDHRAPVVVQMVWYKIGSADEVPGKTGLAHYLEHLMFKGTDTMEPGELSKTVTRNGGMDNAFTSYDYTAYFQRIASDRLPLIMEMEADRMANLQIGEDDWQAERQVVLEERAQRTDSDPRALFAEEASAVQYYNHPYGRPVIGWRSEMMGLTREDAVKWYEDYYSPDRAILILAGDVTPERARELAEQYYGPIPAHGDIAPRVRPQEPDQRSPRRMQMSDPRVAQPVMMRTILAPERNPGDQKKAAALTVLAELLGGDSQTSVLGRQLAQTGKALWVGARYDGLSVDPTTFTLSLVPPPGRNIEEAEAEFDAVLADFVETGPNAEDLDRIKTQISAAQIYARDSAHGRAYDYGQGLATGLTIEDVNDWPDILRDVTAEEVTEAARDVLSSRATVTGWLLPEDQAGPDTASAPALPDVEVAPLPAAADAPAEPAAENPAMTETQ
ncbi:insulinase family protein (plasmid) [Paracoccus sp. TK19116]|uniref:Insulinase family protein n=1 Tax=Paracoccus albicereus TaxID=2922394 RepID=A0ABT1MMG3_9RHOB|nr:pitrilysin family protein [Paracoccus albicereus]MCQ0969475.1 insulinase family protein [Paracoccus albicereus]